MGEHLIPPPRHKILNDVLFPGERRIELRNRPVIGETTTNKQVAGYLETRTIFPDDLPEEDVDRMMSIMEDIIPKMLQDKIIPFFVSLRDSQEHPTLVATFNLKTDEAGYPKNIPWLISPKPGQSLQHMSDLLQEWKNEQSTPYIFDLASQYHPSFAKLPEGEVREKLHTYYSHLKTKLQKNGTLCVQLEDGYEENKEAVEKYNEIVIQELGQAGFAISQDNTYLFEREDGSQGTLYVIMNDDYGLGEHDPHEKEAAGVRRGYNIEEDVQKLLKEMEEALV